MRQKRKKVLRIKASDVKKNIPPYLKNFILNKFRVIDNAAWPTPLKSKVKQIIYAAACSEKIAEKYAQPKIKIPHNALVESYANTLFKEFNRFVASKNVAEFIKMRKLPFRGKGKKSVRGRQQYSRMGFELYGTKNQIAGKILGILEKNPDIPKHKKIDVLNYLKANKKRLTNVQLHRVQHYVVGLAIEAM